MPRGLRIEKFTSADISEVASYLRDLQPQLRSATKLSDDDFTAFVNQSVNSAGEDFRIARLGSDIVGLLLTGTYPVADREQRIKGFRIIVSPDSNAFKSRDLLLRELQRQSASQDVIQRTIIGSDQAGEILQLVQHGFARVQEIALLKRDGPPPPVAGVPPGYAVREADLERDGAMITRLHNVANQFSFGFAPLTVTDLKTSATLMGSRLIVLENTEGDVVGSAQTLGHPDKVGILHSIQIEPNSQGRGLGKFLVTTALNGLAQHGFRRVELSVDAENHVALNLYAILDFMEWRRDHTYELIRSP
jgi:ribosomal protein S18 acetylase RimI-like enzyme